MDTQKLSMRGLARRIDPDNIERSRRNLIRWMHQGISPSRANRIAVAQALGLELSELEEDGDDADADWPALLDAYLERRIHEVVAKALEAA